MEPTGEKESGPTKEQLRDVAEAEMKQQWRNWSKVALVAQN
jgi:hypothetical protein